MPGRTLIVDDHAGFRSIARLVLETAGFEVVGEVDTGAAALSAAADLKPDVVILDIGLPDTSGFRVAEELSKLPDAPAVVLVSSRSEADYGHQVERAAALGFIAKNELSGEAVTALLS